MKQTTKNVTSLCNRDRNTYVISQLRQALLALLADTPLDDISISRLCERAEVGRVSFYRNYKEKEDILRAWIDDLFAEWKDEGDKHRAAPLSVQMQVMFTHFTRHEAFYRLLGQRGLTYLLKDAIINRIGPKPEDDAEQAYAAAYAAYSLYGWLEVWLQRGMKESAGEIAALFARHGL